MKFADRIQVWSSGGGTQSAAIGALICLGFLHPDLAVIVDTEREVEQTWRYHEAVIVPNLARVGVTLHRVPKSRYSKVDLYGGKDGNTLLIPAFTGDGGKLPAYCSNEWKARIVQRFASSMFPNSQFDIWLGISRDEADRMRKGTGKWQYRHPLIDNGRLMSRQDCLSLVRSMGWPDPPRSRCWMCPNQRAAEWNDLEQNWPDDYTKAQQLQQEAQSIDPNIKFRGNGSADCMSGMCFI